MKGIYIFLADGFEDIEALATNDVLRRAGLRTSLTSISDEPFVTSSHGITVGTDECLPFLGNGHDGTAEQDVLIFPGGMPGTKHLASNRRLMSLMKEHYASGGTVAAICAAPGLVLSQLDSLEGKEMTCFDGFEDKLIAKGARFTPRPAVTDGRIITGRSAGHAIAFGMEILRKLKGEEVSSQVRQSLFLETLPE